MASFFEEINISLYESLIFGVPSNLEDQKFIVIRIDTNSRYDLVFSVPVSQLSPVSEGS